MEAKVSLGVSSDSYDLLRDYVNDLPTILIVSQAELQLHNNLKGGVSFKVTKAEGTKCDRCWNIRQDVGSQAQHPTLCVRCVEALG